MDIGYKDISKLDSEEQFIGRINRNFKRKGVVYFFDMDNESGIYKEDYRVDTAYTLRKDEMKQLLADKNFGKYYDYILKGIRKYRNDRKNENGIEAFVDNVKNLCKLVDIDLSRCGSFGSCTEGKGGTEGFAGETADNTGTCHGHGNDRAVGELLGHFQRGT